MDELHCAGAPAGSLVLVADRRRAPVEGGHRCATPRVRGRAPWAKARTAAPGGREDGREDGVRGGWRRGRVRRDGARAGTRTARRARAPPLLTPQALAAAAATMAATTAVATTDVAPGAEVAVAAALPPLHTGSRGREPSREDGGGLLLRRRARHLSPPVPVSGAPAPHRVRGRWWDWRGGRGGRRGLGARRGSPRGRLCHTRGSATRSAPLATLLGGRQRRHHVIHDVGSEEGGGGGHDGGCGRLRRGCSSSWLVVEFHKRETRKFMGPPLAPI